MTDQLTDQGFGYMDQAISDSVREGDPGPACNCGNPDSVKLTFGECSYTCPRWKWEQLIRKRCHERARQIVDSFVIKIEDLIGERCF